MSGEEFILLWSNTHLRQYIVDISRAITRNEKEQIKLYYHAWIHLSELEPDKTLEYYMRRTYSAVRRRYQLYMMKLPSDGRRPASDPGIRRAGRKIKYFKRVVTNPRKTVPI